MEKENFDEELKNRIKQVFEEYDDSSANEGWNLLREKYPAKNRRDYFFWWLGAAIALISIAFIFWLLKPDLHQNKVTKAVKRQAIDSVTAAPDRYASNKKTILNKGLSNPSKAKETSLKTASNFIAKQASGKNKISKQNLTSDNLDTKKTSVKTASNFIAKQAYAKNKISKQGLTSDNPNTKKTLVKTASGFVLNLASTKDQQATPAITQQELQPKPETEDQKNASFTGKKSTSDSISTQTKTPVSVPADSSKQKTLIAAEVKKTSPPVQPSAVKKAATFKKTAAKEPFFSLGFYAGTHLNYADGSNNQLGFGGGIFTDFRLTKKLNLSTGLGLMQNNLTYSQNISNGSLFAASITYAAIPSISIAQNTSLSQIDAHLLTLYIPLNLTYTFLPGKNSISVSAGISSDTFIKEAYDYHYSNSASNTQNIRSFNNFDFAKTLNLAAGFAYPLGKNKLQIEPFLKYPLGGMGSQQLKFGSVGINLKINFQSFKK